MGLQKASLPLGNQTLADHVADQVSAIAGSATIVGSNHRSRFPQIMDLYPGEGPLGGIVTVLQNSGARPLNVIVACDMPRLSTKVLRLLLVSAIEGDAPVYIAATPDGREHPLVGVYRHSALLPLSQQFGSGCRSVIKALSMLPTKVVQTRDSDWALNVNTPADWEVYESKARESAGGTLD